MGQLEQVLRREEQAIYRLRALYRSHGYRPYKINKFEEYDLYAQNKSFLQSDQILTFTDTDGRLMALKPDVTLSILKNAKDDLTILQKSCYSETVYRPSGAYGGFREIMQVGLECIGPVDLYAMGEVVVLALDSLATVAEQYLLAVSHQGVLSSVLDVIVGGGHVKRDILRCIGEKNVHELAALCDAAGLEPEMRGRILELARLHGPLAETLPVLAALCPGQREAIAELEGIQALLEGLPEAAERVILDMSISGDMRYYNGLMFQGFLDGLSAPVLSGGRYDSLVAKLGKRGGAIGFAVYLDQLERFEPPQDYDVDILLLYDDTAEPRTLQTAAETLRSEGRTVRTEREPGNLKYRRLYWFKNGRLVTCETDA